jgi:hypothetical protein
LGERIIGKADRTVQVEYYLQAGKGGFTGSRTRMATTTPVAMRAFVELDGAEHELMAFKPRAMLAMISDFKTRMAAERMAEEAAARLQAEQRAKEDAEREARERVQAMNRDADYLRSRLERADPVTRMLVLQDIDEGGYVTDHLAARWASYVGSASVRVALIVLADESGRDDVKLAWPRHMTVERGAAEAMRDGRWYLVTGDLELERRRDKASGQPLKALLELDTLLECTQVGCGEGADIRSAVLGRYPDTSIFLDEE